MVKINKHRFFCDHFTKFMDNSSSHQHHIPHLHKHLPILKHPLNSVHIQPLVAQAAFEVAVPAFGRVGVFVDQLSPAGEYHHLVLSGGAEYWRVEKIVLVSASRYFVAWLAGSSRLEGIGQNDVSVFSVCQKTFNT